MVVGGYRLLLLLLFSCLVRILVSFGPRFFLLFVWLLVVFLCLVVAGVGFVVLLLLYQLFNVIVCYFAFGVCVDVLWLFVFAISFCALGS